jgi:hypothetical protein
VEVSVHELGKKKREKTNTEGKKKEPENESDVGDTTKRE